MFTGGAVLADLMKDNEDFWISREEWKALGPRKALEKLTPHNKHYSLFIKTFDLAN